MLSIIYGQVYFPTYANNLKSIARFLGFEWSDTSLTGIKSIAYRCDWEKSRNSQIKSSLINYNAEDCQATEVVAQALVRLHSTNPWIGNGNKSEAAVSIESLKNPRKVWGTFKSQFKEFEQINLSAWWNYQRDRISVRSNKRPKPKSPQSRHPRLGPRSNIPQNKTIIYPKLTSCPSCGGALTERTLCDRTLYDLSFGKSYVKRWVIRCRFHHYWCSHCCRRFGEPKEFWPRSHLGRNLAGCGKTRPMAPQTARSSNAGLETPSRDPQLRGWLRDGVANTSHLVLLTAIYKRRSFRYTAIQPHRLGYAADAA